MIRLSRLPIMRGLTRVREAIGPKLIGIFAAILLLLVGMGYVGLEVVAGLNANTQQIIRLQKKIAAYRQIQHDTTNGLFNVSSALLSADEATLSNALRQLYQFSLDLDRLEFVAGDEAAMLAAVREDHRRFEDVVTEVVALIRAGQADAARRLSDTRIGPLAERLEHITNEMVNIAESHMLDGIEDANRAYDISRLIVIAFVVSSASLALVLGHAISWSMVGPVIDRLLHSILPGPAVRELTSTNRVIPRRYDNVAILFGDIGGFTQYCDLHPPEEVVGNLQLFTEAFEELAAAHGLEKIKTVGDAVMATGNLLVPHADPVMACLLLARDLAAAAARNPAQWQFHAGIHVGPVVAGVLGRSKFSFDLWGDTVNLASRLADVGGGAAHLSAEAWAQLSDRCAGTALNGVEIKGKAPMTVYRCDFAPMPPAS